MAVLKRTGSDFDKLGRFFDLRYYPYMEETKKRRDSVIDLSEYDKLLEEGLTEQPDIQSDYQRECDSEIKRLMDIYDYKCEEEFLNRYISKPLIIRHESGQRALDSIGVVNTHFRGYFEVIFDDGSTSIYTKHHFIDLFVNDGILVGIPKNQFAKFGI